MEDNVQVVGGIFDTLFRIKLNKAKVNWKLLSTSIGGTLDAIEPGVETTGNVDKFLFDAAKDAIGHWLTEEAPPESKPLIVGARKPKKPHRSREEAEALIRQAGITEFAPWLVLVIQFLPLAIDALKFLKEWWDNRNKPPVSA